MNPIRSSESEPYRQEALESGRSPQSAQVVQRGPFKVSGRGARPAWRDGYADGDVLVLIVELRHLAASEVVDVGCQIRALVDEEVWICAGLAAAEAAQACVKGEAHRVCPAHDQCFLSRIRQISQKGKSRE